MTELTQREEQVKKLLCELGICLRLMFSDRRSPRVKCGPDCIYGPESEDKEENNKS